ncbi:hypothetical protein DFH07DRAFT_1054417 [Mycena maculata]|uniref:Cullin N-terminal domain-containing protein n=1 Tax=Mycena maculata TaxID=230809 RepID=A0AAD7P2I1_9AGAR|nr:hypothetical protein DFH07DRAFT_1054417 [Mycena maculata]
MAEDANPRISTVRPITDVWKDRLEPGLTLILCGEEPLNYAAHAALYGTIYDCCTRAFPATSQHCRELYSQITPFYAAYTAQIRAAAPDDDNRVPNYYDAQWDQFSRRAVVIDRLFTYLNTHFVGSQRQEGGYNIETVLNVARTEWKKQVFEPRLETALDGGAVRLNTIRALFTSKNVTAAKLKTMHVHAT